MLEAIGVSKTYGSGHSEVRVLESIDFKAGPGKLISIMGRSGCGKSTLLNILAGIDVPTSGRVRVSGKDYSSLTADQLAHFRLRHIGLVFQFFNLLPTLTLQENIAIPAYLLRLTSQETRARVQESLKQVALSGEAARFPHQASGGEIQRAAIARALVARPEILLADEPTGNLDEMNREIVIDLFRSLAKQNNLSVVVVTHDQSFARVSDTVYHLDKGRLQA